MGIHTLVLNKDDCFPIDRFTVRWYGKLTAPETMNHASIDVTTDDEVRLYVDGKKVIDGYRKREIPVDVVVQDMNHWRVSSDPASARSAENRILQPQTRNRRSALFFDPWSWISAGIRQISTSPISLCSARLCSFARWLKKDRMPHYRFGGIITQSDKQVDNTILN
jgi:hypothetical protein